MSRLERNEEWVRFQETVEQAAADNVGRLSKHVDTLVEVASELETFQAAVGERAIMRLDWVKRDLRSTEVKLERLGIAMKTLTSDLHSDVKGLLAKIDKLVRQSYDEELDTMPALIHEFSPTTSSLASTGSALFPVVLKKERFVPRSGTRYLWGERNGNALHFSQVWKVKERAGSLRPFLLRSM